MTLTFRYKKFKRADGSEVKTPSVPITISGKQSKFDFIALLDSGADVSAIPQAIAELLGIDLNGKREETSGIGGSVPAIQSNLTIEIGRKHENYTLHIPVKIILTKDEFPVLLGEPAFLTSLLLHLIKERKKYF